jgi:hypothetical protein
MLPIYPRRFCLVCARYYSKRAPVFYRSKRSEESGELNLNVKKCRSYYLDTGPICSKAAIGNQDRVKYLST